MRPTLSSCAADVSKQERWRRRRPAQSVAPSGEERVRFRGATSGSCRRRAVDHAVHARQAHLARPDGRPPGVPDQTMKGLSALVLCAIGFVASQAAPEPPKRPPILGIDHVAFRSSDAPRGPRVLRGFARTRCQRVNGPDGDDQRAATRIRRAWVARRHRRAPPSHCARDVRSRRHGDVSASAGRDVRWSVKGHALRKSRSAHRRSRRPYDRTGAGIGNRWLPPRIRVGVVGAPSTRRCDRARRSCGERVLPRRHWNGRNLARRVPIRRRPAGSTCACPKARTISNTCSGTHPARGGSSASITTSACSSPIFSRPGSTSANAPPSSTVHALEPPRIGRNLRWQLNLYDPDGTRVELMEPATAR